MKTKRTSCARARAVWPALLAAPQIACAAARLPRRGSHGGPARHEHSRTTGASPKSAAPAVRSALRGAEERSPCGRAQAQLARLHLMLASQCLSEANPKGERSEFDAGRTGEHRRAV